MIPAAPTIRSPPPAGFVHYPKVDTYDKGSLTNNTYLLAV